jgi:hypothetical protein
MTITTQIPQDQWQNFLVTFSNGNQGRALSVEVFDSETGDQPAAKQGPLMAVDYDPVGKGNDIVVTTGVDTIDYSHTIPAPVELWQAQQDNGEVGALEIIDQNNVKTILSLA